MTVEFKGDEMPKYKITPEQIEEWCVGTFCPTYAFDRLADILNGDYSVDEARDDILSLIDMRVCEAEREEKRRNNGLHT